jgi:hypothetical protein
MKDKNRGWNFRRRWQLPTWRRERKKMLLYGWINMQIR